VARAWSRVDTWLVRSFEKNIFTAVLDRNEGTLEESPALTFAPKRISVDTSADIIAQILKLRDRGDISRETTLEELDYDQDVEVLRPRPGTPGLRPGLPEPDSARRRPRATRTPVPQESSEPNARTGRSGPASCARCRSSREGRGEGCREGADRGPVNNLGPKGQPRTEGGRPSGVVETPAEVAKK